MIFSEKEVHIVELDGVSAVFCDQMGENCGSALRRFHALIVAVRGVDAAETTVEGASDAGVMDCCAFAEEGWPEIFFDRHPMEGVPGKLVRAFHGPFSVIARETKNIFIGEAKNRIEGTVAADCVEKFEDCVLA